MDKFFDEIKCYGFIIMEEDNTEIFVHFDDFEKLETKSFAYWISPESVLLINKSKKLSEFADVTQGLATSNNDRFLREVM